MQLRRCDYPPLASRGSFHVLNYSPNTLRCREDALTLSSISRTYGIRPQLRDERCSGRSLQAEFLGTLTTEQHSAVDALLPHDTGVLAATTAFGKTVVAAKLIAERGINTLNGAPPATSGSMGSAAPHIP